MLLDCQVTKLAANDVMGTAIGFVHATRSLCGIVAPVTGGYLIKSYGPAAIGYVPAGLTVLAVFIIPLITNAQAVKVE